MVITLTSLVFRFFELCRLEPVQIRPGIWQVQIEQSLMQELDGRRAGNRLLQFTFEQHLAKKYGAELICEGSYRSNTILRLIQKQGLLTRAYLPDYVFDQAMLQKRMFEKFPQGNRIYIVKYETVYDQHLWIQLLTTRWGLEKRETIADPLINLSTGEVSKFTISTRLFLQGLPNKNTVRTRKLSFKKAFAAAVNNLEQILAEENDEWAQISLQKLEKEQTKLDHFYEGRLDSKAYHLKTEEIKRRFLPKVEIDTLRAALLYIPLYRYRLIVVDRTGQEQNKCIYYDPISNSLALG